MTCRFPPLLRAHSSSAAPDSSRNVCPSVTTAGSNTVPFAPSSFVSLSSVTLNEFFENCAGRIGAAEVDMNQRRSHELGAAAARSRSVDPVQRRFDQIRPVQYGVPQNGFIEIYPNQASLCQVGSGEVSPKGDGAVQARLCEPRAGQFCVDEQRFREVRTGKVGSAEIEIHGIEPAVILQPLSQALGGSLVLWEAGGVQLLRVLGDMPSRPSFRATASMSSLNDWFDSLTPGTVAQFFCRPGPCRCPDVKVLSTVGSEHVGQVGAGESVPFRLAEIRCIPWNGGCAEQLLEIPECRTQPWSVPSLHLRMRVP